MLRLMSPPCGSRRPAPRAQASGGGGGGVLAAPRQAGGGLPMGGGNWMSADRRWRYPAQNLHPPYLDGHRLGSLRVVVSPSAAAEGGAHVDASTRQSARCRLAPCFLAHDHATFGSSSLVATLTFLLPICRHFRRAPEAPPAHRHGRPGMLSSGGRRPGAAAPPPPGLAHGPITTRPGGRGRAPTASFLLSRPATGSTHARGGGEERVRYLLIALAPGASNGPLRSCTKGGALLLGSRSVQRAPDSLYRTAPQRRARPGGRSALPNTPSP